MLVFGKAPRRVALLVVDIASLPASTQFLVGAKSWSWLRTSMQITTS